MEDQEFEVRYNRKTREVLTLPSDQNWDEDELNQVIETVNFLGESIFTVFLLAKNEDEAEKIGMSFIKRCLKYDMSNF